jgi:hypothetical protein
MSYSEATFAQYAPFPADGGEDAPGKDAAGNYAPGNYAAGEDARVLGGAGEDARIEAFAAQNGTLHEYLKNSSTISKSIELAMLTLIDSATDNSAFQEHALKLALHDWLVVTQHIMNYKYIRDMNDYVRNMQSDEKRVLTKQRDAIQNDIMITKHMFMMRQRNADMLYSRVRVLLHGMLFVSALAFLYMNLGWLGAAGPPLIVLFIVAFSVYVIMYFKLSSARRYDDWSKLYWNGGKAVDETPSPPVDPDANSTAQCGNGNVAFD